MKSKINSFSLFFILILLGLVSCDEQEYALGDLTSPTNLQITADIVGKSTDLPNGDGSGDVSFNLSSDNTLTYKVDFGDGKGINTYPSSFVKKFNNVGTKTYRVSVTAVGTGGSATTDIIEIDVYYAYDVNPVTISLLTGDSPTGKTWQIDSDLPGHLGLGPGPGRPDGIPETFEPTWWQAGPNARATKGIYDDRYTFTSTKEFTHQTNGDMYGYKAKFARDFDSDTPGVYGGFGDEWILDYPDYTEGFDYDGNDEGAEFITFGQKGHCGFFNGSHTYMILELTETTMWLRGAIPGTNESTWYVKLKVVD